MGKRTRSRQGAAKPRAALSRHRRKCAVCRHPERDAIERDFLHWRSPEKIAADYHIPDHSSVYRHVHATGLYRRRRANLRYVLGHIIEQASSVKPTARDVVRAVIACTHINDAGQWIEPAREPVPNRQPVRVETNATH
ncbi:MAG: hypothetical protein ABSE45_07445 [Candidatus Acidiferrales bacterium]|jgi:hypothetical protein